ncbi:GUN4 domain-containing protein [Fischerella muscicola]|nr:GUN4 domain-containing protein [Fischerella muscicola]MBD2433994.1 GUN4 domain-containing protein [Fischerella sp. FACHB-380]
MQDKYLHSTLKERSQQNYHYEHKIKKTETFNAFGEEVGWKGRLGWKRKEDLTYDLRSPQGHLPAKVFLWCRKDLFSEYCSPLIIEINGKYFSDNSLKVVSVMQRFQDCKLSKETLPRS